MKAKTNLIIAGAILLICAGFLGTTNVSAINGPAFGDIVNRYRDRVGQIKSYLLNPLSSDCESANPEGSISCNEVSSPNLLFNGAPNNTAWGHDGKGLIFVNNDNLINGDPQLAAAKRGDTLNYSMEIRTQRYNDEAAAKPVKSYMVYGLFSKGLNLAHDSITVKVGGQTLDASAYQFEFAEFEEGGDEATIFGGARSAFYLTLPWINDANEFIYDEGAVINITYSADIADDSPEEVYSRGVYLSDDSSVDFSILSSTEHQATAMLDGNIIIRRADSVGNPLSGAKYVVDGVKANQGDNGAYVYDKNGQIDEFVTDEKGQVVILGVPFGEYAVTEISSPDGSTPQERIIIKSLAANIENSVVSQTTGFEVPEEEVAFGMRMGLLSATAIKDGLWMVKIPGETMDGSLNYDSQENCWIGAESYEEVKVCRGADGQLYAAQGTMNIPSNRPLIYNPDNDTYFLTVSGPDLHYYQMQIIKTDDTTITLKVGSKQFILQRDSANDCFHVDLTEVIGNSRTTVDPDSTICTTDADTYDLSYTVTVYEQGPFVRNEHFEKLIVTDELLNDASFDPTLQYYVSDYPFMALSLRLDSSNTMAASPGYPISYVAPYDKYFLAFAAPSPAQLEAKYRTIDNYQYVTPFLFRPSTNTDSPEDISNPQTGDAVLKTVIIVAIGLAPVVILRRQLTKRSH